MTAVTRLRCYEIAFWDFRKFAKENPDFAWKLFQQLAALLTGERERTARAPRSSPADSPVDAAEPACASVFGRIHGLFLVRDESVIFARLAVALSNGGFTRSPPGRHGSVRGTFRLTRAHERAHEEGLLDRLAALDDVAGAAARHYLCRAGLWFPAMIARPRKVEGSRWRAMVALTLAGVDRKEPLPQGNNLSRRLTIANARRSAEKNLVMRGGKVTQGSRLQVTIAVSSSRRGIGAPFDQGGRAVAAAAAHGDEAALAVGSL